VNYLKGQIETNEVEAVLAIEVFTQYLSMVDASSLGLDLEQILNHLKN
jgi:hypothetical protein